MTLITAQQSNIREHILKERTYGLPIGLDESGDPISETEPVNDIIVIARACYFVGVFFDPEAWAKTQKYSDAFRQEVALWIHVQGPLSF